MYKYWVIQINSPDAQTVEDMINRRASEGWRVVSTSSVGGSLYIILER